LKEEEEGNLVPFCWDSDETGRREGEEKEKVELC